MKNAGVENAGLENVGPNRRGGKDGTGKHGTKEKRVEFTGLENAGPNFSGWKTHNHRLLNAKWVSIKLKGTLYDMFSSPDFSSVAFSVPYPVHITLTA